MKDSKLKPGDVICDKCLGSGFDENTKKNCRNYLNICDKCNGDGKLDWVENVTGKVSSKKANIIINQTADNIFIEDLGITIKAGSQFDLSDYCSQKDISNSESLKDLIREGDIKFISWKPWS